jgi:hypothetical protein
VPKATPVETLYEGKCPYRQLHSDRRIHRKFCSFATWSNTRLVSFGFRVRVIEQLASLSMSTEVLLKFRSHSALARLRRLTSFTAETITGTPAFNGSAEQLNFAGGDFHSVRADDVAWRLAFAIFVTSVWAMTRSGTIAAQNPDPSVGYATKC